jgi:hypothetical protein
MEEQQKMEDMGNEMARTSHTLIQALTFKCSGEIYSLRGISSAFITFLKEMSNVLS